MNEGEYKKRLKDKITIIILFIGLIVVSGMYFNEKSEKEVVVEYVEVPACVEINETIFCPQGFVTLGEIDFTFQGLEEKDE